MAAPPPTLDSDVNKYFRILCLKKQKNSFNQLKTLTNNRPVFGTYLSYFYTAFHDNVPNVGIAAQGVVERNVSKRNAFLTTTINLFKKMIGIDFARLVKESKTAGSNRRELT